MQSKASQGINMRNRFFLLCVLLLVGGVYGDQKVGVSVMDGDSVTLKPDAAEIQRDDDEIMWKYNGSIVARMKKTTGLFSTFDGPDKIFRDGRLQLDNQTRYLTITNIRTTDSGKYQLHIRNIYQEIFNEFSVTVRDTVKSVSVVEGDTVTLHTGVTGIQRDEIQWKFGGVLIADLKGPDGATWRNLNNETGEITNSNIPKNQSGDYMLEINTSSMILCRKLHITIRDEMKTVSVKEGEDINLDTGLNKTQGYDQILWKFGDHLISELNKLTLGHTANETNADGRFKGRVWMPPNTGSLTIRPSTTNDTGDYHLNMSSSSHTVQRSISVTVSDSGSVSGISGASVGLTLWAVTVFLLHEV